MATLKEIQGKINSLKKTQKITSAMKMISTTKLNRCLPFIGCSKDYREAILQIADNLRDHFKQSSNPLLKKKNKIKKVKLITFTSNRGLCGAFNSYVCKSSMAFVEKQQDKKVEIDFFGKKGFEFFELQEKKNFIKLEKKRLLEFPCGNKSKNLEKDIPAELPIQEKIVEISQELIKEFLEGEVDEVFLSYNYFHSRISQKPYLEKLLPFEKKWEKKTEEKVRKNLWIFEPNVDELVQELLDLFITQNLYFAFLSTLVGEHAARMTAMDNASRNCGDLIERYTLERNRTRQAAITTELVEIISGSESL